MHIDEVPLVRGKKATCPICGAKIPLDKHPSKNALVAYHNCDGKGNRAMVQIPIIPTPSAEVEEGVSNG